MGAFLICMVLVGVATLALPVIILLLSSRADRAAREQLEKTGARCVAFVRSYRRISMTQHRVLFEIHLPSGPIGREYVVSGLADHWLADVGALGRPVRVCAHPDASTILFV
jgi:hypothetical protein